MKGCSRILLFCVVISIAACQEKKEASYQEKEGTLLRALLENDAHKWEDYTIGEYSGIFNISEETSGFSDFFYGNENRARAARYAFSLSDSAAGEAWRVEYPYNFKHQSRIFDLWQKASVHNNKSDVFMTVKGRLSPKGQYGHLGTFDRELIVDDVLLVEKREENPEKLIKGNIKSKDIIR